MPIVPTHVYILFIPLFYVRPGNKLHREFYFKAGSTVRLISGTCESQNMPEFAIHAELRTDKTPFRELEVEDALSSEEEFIMGYENDDVVYTVYRTVNAENEEKAREKAIDGKLLTSVPHVVERIIKIRNRDKPL